MQIQWIKYEDSKPVNNGVYLIANEDTDPPFRACSYYDTVHGWSGIGHVLERLINYWAEFPICPKFKEYVEVQSSTDDNQ